MKQAVIATPISIDVVSVPKPTLRGPGEILLRTAVSGICSGDLMTWYLAKKVGTVLGHEIVGWAEEVEDEVAHVKRGDLVFVHHHAPCHACTICKRGDFVHCSTWKRTHLDPGGMAEWVRVPAENVVGDTFAVNDLTPEQAVFIEPLACCVKAYRRIGKQLPLAGGRAAIVGCGIMGLLNLQTALAYGAREVIVVEPDEGRRKVALAMGAASALTPQTAEGELTRVMDYVLIGPGQPNIILQSLAYVRDAGVALLFTPTATGVVTPLDLGDLYFRDVSLIPSYSCGPEDTREAYELLRSGRVRPETIVTHRYRLERVQEAFDMARRWVGFEGADYVPKGRRTMKSSCEIPEVSKASTTNGSRVLRFQPATTDASGHRWTGVPVIDYKEAADHHCGVTRSVLIGNQGEQTAFQVRYFEVQPGGHSTLEHHRHEHVVVVLRGQGEVQLGAMVHHVTFGDTIYVAPNEVHQLRNPSLTEPFGFLCMVDAERDRPVVVDDQ